MALGNLPWHRGSHDNYNRAVATAASNELDWLLRTHRTVDRIPADEIREAIENIIDKTDNLIDTHRNADGRLS